MGADTDDTIARFREIPQGDDATMTSSWSATPRPSTRPRHVRGPSCDWIADVEDERGDGRGRGASAIVELSADDHTAWAQWYDPSDAAERTDVGSGPGAVHGASR